MHALSIVILLGLSIYVLSQDCPEPYHVKTDDGCVWSCAEGTTPDNDSNECVCQYSYVEDGYDRIKRRTCKFDSSECLGPYHVATDDDRCVWSCAEGTTPDNDSNECVCQYSYVEDGYDKFKRRTCKFDSSECLGPYHVATDDDRCVWSCAEGTTPDNDSLECVCQPGYIQEGKDKFGRRTCIPDCLGPYHGVNKEGYCVWSCAEGTTPDNDSQECVCEPGYVENGQDSFGRRTCKLCPGPYHVVSNDGRCVWSCSTGTTPDDISQECVCQPGYVVNGQDSFSRRTCVYCPGPYHVFIPNEDRCVWSCAAGTTPDNLSYECACQPGYIDNGFDSFGRRTCKIYCPGPYHVATDDGRCVWSCAAGTTPDNMSNECICQPGYVDNGTDQFNRRTCKINCPGPYHVGTDYGCVWSCSAGTTPDNVSNECICQPGYVENGQDTFGRRTCV